MSSAYYNENDPYAAQWLRNLIAAGHLPAGEVDDRSILDVRAADLAAFTECHFFAGIAGWPLALQLAGWTGPVWTGSCPCQPLSSAGQRRGHADERHLWPAFYRLIAECRPATVIGEQVASKDGREWLSGIRADLEHLGYAVGAADLPAAGVGAPHIRQRLFWGADAERARCRNDAGPAREVSGEIRQQRFRPDAGADGSVLRGLADADSRHAAQERQGHRPLGEQRQAQRGRPEQPAGPGAGSRDGDGHLAQGNGGLADASGERRQQVGRRPPRDEDAHGRQPNGHHLASGNGATGGLADARHDDGTAWPARGEQQSEPSIGERLGSNCAESFWDDAVWLGCLDGKARRALAAIQPLVDARGCICGLRVGEECACAEKPSRVGMLRGAGNAISPPVAAEFIRAFMDVANAKSI